MYFEEIFKCIIIPFSLILYRVITITLFHFILKLYSKQTFWKVLKLIFNDGFRIKNKKKSQKLFIVKTFSKLTFL